MKRKIIKIDAEKCNGCGLCADACHEGAIAMIDGKAKLMRDDYCDGLGNCLPVCPTGAITFEEREAAEFADHNQEAPGCPGSHALTFKREEIVSPAENEVQGTASRLHQWPVQIKLVPVNASYFKNANLLIAADCSAFACGDFHNRFMKNKVTLIGCPKLDSIDYSDKLTEIISNNSIKSVTVVKMEVPCCGGIEYAAVAALQNSGKFLPWQVVTLSTGGEILEE